MALKDSNYSARPDERPYIERFFGTIANRLSSRLPGYMGSHPRDLRLFVSLDQLEELVEYAIADYNGGPHSGLNHATQLEAIEYFVRGRQSLVTWLAEYRRRVLCLMQSAHRCRVRAYLQGVRPYINLHGVRYTSEVLATSTQLIGKQLLVYMNADDRRCVRAFLSDGGELGKLDAQGAWCVFPHNLKLRQEINKLKGKRQSRSAVGLNPIEAFIREKFAQAKKTRKGATEYARGETARVAPTVRTPVGPLHHERTDILRNEPGPQPVTLSSTFDSAPLETGNPVRPLKLSIGTGQVY
jgi:putative transposase